MCPGNLLRQGGYEARKHHFPPRYSIAMVKTAVDATYELQDMVYPLPPGQEERDYLDENNQFKLQISPL
jgi:hypothetical protein